MGRWGAAVNAPAYADPEMWQQATDLFRHAASLRDQGLHAEADTVQRRATDIWLAELRKGPAIQARRNAR